MITNLEQINKLVQSKILFAFDFDGVIADSVEVKTEAFYSLYQPYGDAVAQKVIEHHRANSGISRFEKFRHYHQLFLNIQIDRESMHQLSKDFSKLVISKVIASPEIEGVREFLDKLSRANRRCIINSATPKEEIVEIVEKRNLSKYFTEIYGSPASKIDNLKSAIIKYNLKPRDVLFFGDAEADLMAAESLNIQFVGIGSGIYEILDSSNHNNYFLEDFKEIASI